MSITTYGNFTWKLFMVWSKRAESINKMGSQVVPQTFHDMDIFPSSSQVHEMLQCANECSKRQNGDYITFGEFCVYASELKSCYENKIPRPTPLSKSAKETRKLSNRRRSAVQRSSKYQVFLGGSCNPTTWRRDIAIPFFKKLGITYYNPQVAQWGPELIELENQAKQNAEVMFFVIDNQTRSVASMIEASQIAGTQRKLILVIHEFEKPGAVVMGETVTEKEFRDLQQGQRYLQDLVERQGIPVFNNIDHAVQCTATILQKNIKPQDLTIADAAQPVKMAYIQIGDKLIKLKEVFDDLDSDGCGEITLKDVCMAFKILTSSELPIEKLKAVVLQQKGFPSDTLKNSSFENCRIDFNQFCCIMTEFRSEAESGSLNFAAVKSKASDFLCSVLTPLSKLVDWIRPGSTSDSDIRNVGNDVSYDATLRDVYLGGTRKPSTWREDIAIPLLKKKGLTYFSPQDGVWSERLIPMEATNMENSQVLLFVIKNDSRSLADMILAAHYVGLGCQVVLCIQYIPDDTEIDGEKLSTQAVKDYNRGRVYLSDLATRAGVPVFEEIDEAVNCAVNMCLQNS
ncbi:uncharacterized protein LOC118190228 isoform X2 [Stegodyphus dumicola]|uniref:uncharacterized protein LOC118190228 isoform X2 n=1 Tax=Stegodyphus dumicola TaxID=202533 RepID=UPI0015B28D72|nr:uncharacterized protein LOC118190228 isoform X2 [Stegodyphus dumicola]XP_035216799.1 uncharacterized protein LOC118190228 isoform X2 [Stegodyphus dumicola]XP_035216800.1 uncharacterized protein LOC118190228 isoform X2 [Stegodyphus dumicola]XP_035216801.1 uncharacterized protein LOC118190228 isoform X2 [Stegodyphus dumicola]